jgi:peroxiredoxin
MWKSNLKSLIKASCLSLLVLSSSASALNVGDVAPGFELPAADGKSVKLGEFSGKIVVLEWTNPGCPYVKKHYSAGNMQRLQQELRDKGVVWLTINSTNSEHSDFVEKKERLQFVKDQRMTAESYLTDEDGKVGLAYEAKTTPHLFVIDKNGNIAYQGAIDDTPMGDPTKAKNYVVQAVNELLAGEEVTIPDTKPYGCSVKY